MKRLKVTVPVAAAVAALILLNGCATLRRNAPLVCQEWPHSRACAAVTLARTVREVAGLNGYQLTKEAPAVVRISNDVTVVDLELPAPVLRWWIDWQSLVFVIETVDGELHEISPPFNHGAWCESWRDNGLYLGTR